MFWFRLFSYRQTPSKSYSKWKLASIWRSLEMFQIWIHIQTKQKKWDYARILKFLGIFMSNKVSFCESCATFYKNASFLLHWVIHLVICPVILIPPCYPPGYLPMPPCYPPPPWPSVYQPSYPHSYPSSYLMLPNLINQFIKLSDGDLQCEWNSDFYSIILSKSNSLKQCDMSHWMIL